MFKKANYIYTVYQEQSFTKAAGKLYISQPCLSAAVKKTEQLVGAPLFTRDSNRVKPTELGLEYIRIAEQILSLEAQFKAKIRDMDSLACGTVRVGGSNYVSSYILPRIIDRFSQRYPDVTISLTEADSAKLTELLDSEQLDLVVDSFDAEPENCTCRPLLKEKILLAVPETSACNSGLQGMSATPKGLFEDPKGAEALPEVSAQAFAREKFILLKVGNSMHAHAMEIFRQAGFVPQVSLFLDQLSTSYSLAAQGNGCCFVTDTVFRYHCFDDPVRLYNAAGSRHRTLSVASKKGRHITPAQKAFMDTAEASIK